MLTCLLLAAAACMGDTLTVGHAALDGCFTINQAYVTDSLNTQGKTLDVTEALSQNATLVCRPEKNSESTQTIARNEALTTSPDSLPVLRTMHFTLQSKRFLKGHIEVKKLKNYKLYFNSHECTDGSFTLEPGRAKIVLQALTQKYDRDTFDVQITGDSLRYAQVNATGKRPYTMADMIQGSHYHSVRISPTGKYLVTTAYFLKPDGKPQHTTTLTETATGREIFRRNGFLRLNWLPVPKDVLYFTRDGNRGRELVVFNPSDGKERVLAENIPDGEFSVSPNEDYLIVSKQEEGKKSADGLKRLQEPDDRQPGWRNRNSLWRYDIASGFMQRLTYGSSSVWLSDISADGKKLLLQYSRFDASRTPFDRTTIVRMDALTGRVDTLLADTAFVASACFSPDGRQILVCASPAAFDGLGSEVGEAQIPNAFDYKLYLYDIATHTATFVTPGFNPSVDDYKWACGDGRIYILATEGPDRNLFSLDINSKKITRFNLPLTYISGYTVASHMREPRAVFFGQTSERAREMFTARLDKASPDSKRIGPITFEETYKNIAIGTCHTWRFKATRGDTIDGFFFLPPDFDGKKKYPLIVYYYGGCTPTSRCLEFQYPLQILAGQGYVVYVPNPSGATGYGQKFAARHVNTWGKESGDDIIEGTKAFLNEHPYADADRVGCLGASYGGFMTEYLQTRTDLFAAAIAHAGISNIASYWGGGYWGYSYGECAQYGSYPWNNPDLYVRQSPLFNADKIHTPLLLLHGTADTNVPTSESQQLFTALKILGREVSYVQIDGENHVITDYKKRLAWQNVIFAWFAKYLKGDSTWWDSLEL